MEIVQSIITAVYFIFGGILLFLAGSIVRGRLSVRLNRITGLMLFFAAMGPIFLAMGQIVKPNVSAAAPFEESIIYNLLYVWELFFPSFLLFALIFPVDRLSTFRFPKLKYLIFFPHVFHVLLVVVFNNPDKVLNLLEVGPGEGFLSLILQPLSYVMKFVVLGFSLLLSSQKSLFSIINLIYIGLAVYFILRGRAQITNRQLRNQSAVIIWGISIATGLYAGAFLLPEIFSYDTPDYIQTIIVIAALVVGGGSVGWSIIRHQFLDVSVIVRQSLAYTISSGILVGLYILLVDQADKIITSFFGAKTTIVNIAFIVVALILFQPINQQLDNLIKRLFVRNRADYRNIMELISRRLISIFDPEQLRNMIEKTLISTLLVDKVYFALFDDKEQEYALLASENFPEKVVINRDDLLLRGIGQLETPILLDRLSVYRAGSSLSQELDDRKVQLILPLKDSEHLLGFLALTEKASGFRYNAEDITMLGVMSNQLVTVLTNARLYADSLEKQRLDEELTMARQIQLDLLPKMAPRAETFVISARSLPSRTIGGDFYDFIPRSDGIISMVIADASGKGMPAALLVTQIQAMLRSETANNTEISRILQNINGYVVESTSSEKFVTLFYGEFDQKNQRFRYANAGHNYPILVRSDGTHECLSHGGILIGAFGGAIYQEATVDLHPDDLLFMYTDGLSEAQNQTEEEYGEGRIIDFIIKNRHLPPETLIDGILRDMHNFDQTEPPRDDTTLVVLKILKGNNQP
ncbi:putative Phosphoserine phosphatase [Candidatus Zixiibacteriota bacterium]|nr:putative Phosphoserine phosphatase [candidate division Zixibacteria bacterium]